MVELTAGAGVGSGVGELVTISVGGLTVGSLLAFSFSLEQLVVNNRMLADTTRDFPSIGRVVRKLFTQKLYTYALSITRDKYLRNQMRNVQGGGIGLKFFSFRQVSKTIGDVSPLGWISKPEIILIDEALSDYDAAWAAAGHPHAVYQKTYDELIQCTGEQPMIVGD